MTKQTRKTSTSRRHYSPSASVHVVHSINPIVQAILVLGVMFSIGASTYAAITGGIAERESRLQRLEVDEMKVALATQGIKVHEGASP